MFIALNTSGLLLRGYPSDNPLTIISIRENLGDGYVVKWVPDGINFMMDEGLGGYRDPRIDMAEADVRTCVRADVDVQTDLIIATGFEYSDPVIRFKMDLEHQMSYLGIYTFRNGITYPFTIKGVGENYLTFQNVGELEAFCGYGFGWMQAVLSGGWTIKSGLDALTKEQLLAWVDPRI